MTLQTDVEGKLPNGSELLLKENAERGFISTFGQAQKLVRLPRQLVASVMNGQVGVESSGVLWAGESGGSGLAPGTHHSGSSALVF